MCPLETVSSGHATLISFLLFEISLHCLLRDRVDIAAADALAGTQRLARALHYRCNVLGLVCQYLIDLIVDFAQLQPVCIDASLLPPS